MGSSFWRKPIEWGTSVSDMNMDIDQARGDDAVPGIDAPFRRPTVQVADGHDAVALYADIRPEPRRAGAVDEPGVGIWPRADPVPSAA